MSHSTTSSESTSPVCLLVVRKPRFCKQLRALREWLQSPASLCVIIALAALVIAGDVLAQERYHSNPWLLSWIPATCCVTNDCCWEISERELKPLPDDEWVVLATGQVRKRTAWSPDGRFYRCACDQDSATKQWVRHQGANTRCLFVPMRSASRPLRALSAR